MTALPVEPQTMADVERAREAHRRLWSAPSVPQAPDLPRPRAMRGGLPAGRIEWGPPPGIKITAVSVVGATLVDDEEGPEEGRVTIDLIARVVAQFHGISAADLMSHRRIRPLLRPRQIAMFLAKEMTPLSVNSIARLMDGRDHTTILHALRVVGERIASDPQVAARVEAIRAKILRRAGA